MVFPKHIVVLSGSALFCQLLLTFVSLLYIRFFGKSFYVRSNIWKIQNTQLTMGYFNLCQRSCSLNTGSLPSRPHLHWVFSTLHLTRIDTLFPNHIPMILMNLESVSKSSLCFYFVFCMQSPAWPVCSLLVQTVTSAYRYTGNAIKIPIAEISAMNKDAVG